MAELLLSGSGLCRSRSSADPSGSGQSPSSSLGSPWGGRDWSLSQRGAHQGGETGGSDNPVTFGQDRHCRFIIAFNSYSKPWTQVRIIISTLQMGKLGLRDVSCSEMDWLLRVNIHWAPNMCQAGVCVCDLSQSPRGPLAARAILKCSSAEESEWWGGRTGRQLRPGRVKPRAPSEESGQDPKGSRPTEICTWGKAVMAARTGTGSWWGHLEALSCSVQEATSQN